MTTLVECWNKLDGNVGELSSWVATKVKKLSSCPYILYEIILYPIISKAKNKYNVI